MMTDTAVPVVNAGYDGMGAGADWFLWLIVIFALLFNGNGFGFGGAGNALTQAELQAGLYNQTMDRNLSEIRNAQCNTDMLINNTNYNSLSQFKDLSQQLSECCCENRLAIANQTNALASAIHAEGEATRSMIQSDKIEQLRDQVYSSNLALNNANLANTVINAVRPTPIPSYLTCSPYFAYNPYGGCGCTGTTIV